MMATLKVELPPEGRAEEARSLLAIKLFETGHLSLGQAANLAGHSRTAFMELLGNQGVPLFDYSADDLRDEVRP